MSSLAMIDEKYLKNVWATFVRVSMNPAVLAVCFVVSSYALFWWAIDNNHSVGRRSHFFDGLPCLSLVLSLSLSFSFSFLGLLVFHCCSVFDETKSIEKWKEKRNEGERKKDFLLEMEKKEAETERKRSRRNVLVNDDRLDNKTTEKERVMTIPGERAFFRASTLSTELVMQIVRCRCLPRRVINCRLDFSRSDEIGQREKRSPSQIGSSSFDSTGSMINGDGGRQAEWSVPLPKFHDWLNKKKSNGIYLLG